jgi:hypothetical protein
MQRNDLIQAIKDNLPRLPLSFSYLGSIKAEGGSNNYNSISTKPDIVHALQTNFEPVGFFHKPMSRTIIPVTVPPKLQEMQCENREVATDGPTF